MTMVGPSIAEIQAQHNQLSGSVLRTPVIRCPALEARLAGGTEVFAKLEFLQRTGSFKVRGAIATMQTLSKDQLLRGVTAVSAGNHAIATAYAAQMIGTSAKVLMTPSANTYRIESCKSYGAEITIADDIHHAFRIAKMLQEDEGRYLVHPFDGPLIALGTGTIGLEICDQVDHFDSIIVPIGGGGLIGGLSNAVKQLKPETEIIGVEPEGADSMHRSFIKGAAEKLDGAMTTIADSLGAPFSTPYSYELTKENVDRLVMIEDLQIQEAMGSLFKLMNIAVEPACAASTAALLGPLRKSLQGKRVVLVMCGSNIDWDSFYRYAVFNDVD
ncbi:MAG: threonine/serine dehydratase [Woeseiaceae bacterium]|nr:threonine/serine dehydratase [Woeseiaceae bacterium]